MQALDRKFAFNAHPTDTVKQLVIIAEQHDEMEESVGKQEATFYETLLTQHGLFVLTRVAHMYSRMSHGLFEKTCKCMGTDSSRRNTGSCLPHVPHSEEPWPRLDPRTELREY